MPHGASLPRHGNFASLPDISGPAHPTLAGSAAKGNLASLESRSLNVRSAAHEAGVTRAAVVEKGPHPGLEILGREDLFA